MPSQYVLEFSLSRKTQGYPKFLEPLLLLLVDFRGLLCSEIFDREAHLGSLGDILFRCRYFLQCILQQLDDGCRRVRRCSQRGIVAHHDVVAEFFHGRTIREQGIPLRTLGSQNHKLLLLHLIDDICNVAHHQIDMPAQQGNQRRSGSLEHRVLELYTGGIL